MTPDPFGPEFFNGHFRSFFRIIILLKEVFDMANVYVFLTTGFEEIEALTVVDLLRRAKIDVLTVSLTGEKIVIGARNIPVVADKLFDEVSYSDDDMLVLPGGSPGWMNLEKDGKLMKLVDEFALKGGKISAICGAPSILGRRGILSGKKACVYPGMDDELKGALVSHDEVCKDGNIITSRGLGTAIAFSLEIISTLQGSELSRKISDSVVYKLS